MNERERIVICGAGLVSAVGLDTVSSAAAIRAGIRRFKRIPGFVTRKGAMAAGAFAYGLTDDRSGGDRLLAMAVPALQEALFSAEDLCEEIDLQKTRLLLCVGPSQRPAHEQFERQHAADLTGAAEVEELVSSTAILRGGHSIGISALNQAVALLYETAITTCIVGAVDCLLELPVLAWLEGAGRLKNDHRSEGLIPGEAAAFLVLERERETRRRGAVPLTELAPPGLAEEPAHSTSGLPVRGLGLAKAMKQGLGSRLSDAIICDLNGEYFRSKEWALALPRVFDGSHAFAELWHPAENIGDVGAASGLVFPALAATAIKAGYFSGPNVFVITSSDDALRGAAVVSGLQREDRGTGRPQFARSLGVKRGRPDILEEYIEEAAFLYHARFWCLSRPDLSLENLPSREERLDANLHGLVLGGIDSAQLLKSKLMLEENGDPGEAFVAGAVYPSLGLVEPMEWLTSALGADGPHKRAIVEGLIYANDKRVEPWVCDYLAHESPSVRAAGADVVGGCFLSGLQPRLHSLLEDKDPHVFLAAARALGTAAPSKRLTALLQVSEPGIVEQAALLLLRSGERDVIGVLRERLKNGQPALARKLILLIGVAGDASDAQLIVEAIDREPEIALEGLLALGLAGSVRATDYLISWLIDPLREGKYKAACRALHTLTGKNHWPNFDLEEPPTGAVARFQELWRHWYREEGGKYSSGEKCRLGRPLSPAVLFADLSRPGNPHRDLSFLEMKLRYRCPVDLHHDARYAIQAMQFNQIKSWVERAERENQTGKNPA